MTIINVVLLGFLMGIIFGFCLEKSKVFAPGIIIGQFQLKNFTMLKVFLSAIIVGLIVFSIFFTLGFERLNWKTTIYAADILGGLSLGIGIAIAGACPGTLFAQIGVGYKDAFATLFGALVGSAAYIFCKPWLNETLLALGPHQKLTLDNVMGLLFYQAASLLVVFLVIVLYMLEKYYPWRKQILDF